MSISQKQVDFANEQAASRGVGDKVRYRFRTMLDTGFATGSRRAIWNNESTMYVDLFELFAEHARQLEFGGRYVTTTGCYDDVTGGRSKAVAQIDQHHTTSTFTGLGTSAARFAARLGSGLDLGSHHPENGHDPAYAHRPWGDGTASPLYCPLPERIDDTLGEEVDRRLAAWSRECGFSVEEAGRLGRAGFGRLVVLAHPDCDDPDRLLVSAKLNAAWKHNDKNPPAWSTSRPGSTTASTRP